MSINRTILDALNAQLGLKKSEIVTFEETVKKQNTKDVDNGVLTWMREYVDSAIDAVSVCDQHIYIYPNDTKGYSDAVTIYKRNRWTSDSSEKKYNCELSWFSSNAVGSDTRKLNYLSVLGNVAKCFLAIEDEYINTWSNLLRVVDDQSSQMYKEIYRLEHSIRETEEKIKQEEIDKYRQVGFEIKFAKATTCSWNNDGTRSIKETEPNLALYYGRGKWDRVFIKSFKVLSNPKVTKGKYSLLVTQMHGDSESIIEVNTKRMEQFLNDLLVWETRTSKNEAANAQKVYANYLRTVSAEVNQ